MNEFHRQEAERQHAFRESSPTISDCARRPQDEHFLAVSYENENLYPGVRGPDGALAFFEKRGIKW